MSVKTQPTKPAPSIELKDRVATFIGKLKNNQIKEQDDYNRHIEKLNENFVYQFSWYAEACYRSLYTSKKLTEIIETSEIVLNRDGAEEVINYYKDLIDGFYRGLPSFFNSSNPMSNHSSLWKFKSDGEIIGDIHTFVKYRI